MKSAGKRILRTVQLRGGECARTERFAAELETRGAHVSTAREGYYYVNDKREFMHSAVARPVSPPLQRERWRGALVCQESP